MEILFSNTEVESTTFRGISLAKAQWESKGDCLQTVYCDVACLLTFS